MQKGATSPGTVENLQQRIAAQLEILKGAHAELVSIKAAAERLPATRACKAEHGAREKAGKDYEIPAGCTLAHEVYADLTVMLDNSFDGEDVFKLLRHAATITPKRVRAEQRAQRKREQKAAARRAAQPPRPSPFSATADALAQVADVIEAGAKSGAPIDSLAPVAGTLRKMSRAYKGIGGAALV